MKSFTSLEQSKKLAEILPLESADMCWCNNSIKGVNYTDEYSANLYTVKEMKDVFDKALNGWDKYWKLIPCWSLAALLNILPCNLKLVLAINDYQGERKERYAIGSVEHNKYDCYADNPVDACYEMILKLHEQKLL